MNRRMDRWIWAAALTMLVITIALYPLLPDRIATHWNIYGEKDQYSSPMILFLFPFLLIGLDGIMSYAQRLDTQHRHISTWMKGYERMRIVFLLVIFVVFIVIVSQSLFPNVYPVQVCVMWLIGIILMILGNVMPQIHTNRWMGFRNPWTCKDEFIWRKTHRMAGFLWFFAGILVCAASFLKALPAFIITMIIIFLIIAIPILYSYQLYKQRKELTND